MNKNKKTKNKKKVVIKNKKVKKVIKKTIKKTVKKIKKLSKKNIKKITPKKKNVSKKIKPVKKVKSKVGQSNGKLSNVEKKLIDLESKAIEKGKKRGFVTYDEIIKTFPDIESNVLFLDELYEKLSVSGIDVLEGGNLLDNDGDIEKMALKYSKDPHTYDSIQMYLKEIGQYPLILASEEKDYAKR